jgi:hypothetical protein
MLNAMVEFIDSAASQHMEREPMAQPMANMRTQ